MKNYLEFVSGDLPSGVVGGEVQVGRGFLVSVIYEKLFENKRGIV
ncbi:hypothetical protein V5G99_07850 [Bibersteinia trehalosi]